jgi:hypothetical protein
MSDKREDIRVLILDSLFLLMFFLLMLLAINISDFNTSGRPDKSLSTEVSLIHSNATVCTGINVLSYQKNLISDKIGPKVLTIATVQSIDSKKVNQKITLLEKIRKSSILFPNFLLQFHIFPREREELPVLS